MALPRMTPEGRALLVKLVRSPAEMPGSGLIPDLRQLGFIEKLDTRWQATRAGKDYLQAQR